MLNNCVFKEITCSKSFFFFLSMVVFVPISPYVILPSFVFSYILYTFSLTDDDNNKKNTYLFRKARDWLVCLFVSFFLLFGSVEIERKQEWN